ncbi:hypothetical protein [Candidatus Poriferisocius sp.]|uniref:hypothetical protein n=1 Tax=Candidatus Poriferisocius sp. TaxID=3101276 RepID=UPI003B527069
MAGNHHSFSDRCPHRGRRHSPQRPRAPPRPRLRPHRPAHRPPTRRGLTPPPLGL